MEVSVSVIASVRRLSRFQIAAERPSTGLLSIGVESDQPPLLCHKSCTMPSHHLDLLGFSSCLHITWSAASSLATDAMA